MKTVRLAVLAVLLAGAALTSLGAGPASAAGCVQGTPSPSSVTEAAGGISDSAATLHGTVNPHGCATTYRFEYGTTTSYGMLTTVQSAGAGTAAVAAASAVSGLAADTLYYVRLITTSAAGSTTGQQMSFTTAADCAAGGTVPSATTSSAASIGTATATLRGSVDPHGCPTTYRFEYGTTPQFGQTTAARSAGSGNAPITAAIPVAGLTPGTVYYYRVIAASGAGAATGAQAAFKTGSACVRGGPLPSVVTGSAAPVQTTSATLRASVDPHGCATTYRFEYGTTGALGRVTPARSAGTGNAAVAAAATVTGLAPDTVYFYRVVADSATGSAVGREAAVRTARNCAKGGEPPVGATDSAVAISAVGATLQGSVDPRGCNTAYRFDYGTTSRFGQTTPVQSAGTGTTTVTITAAVTGLAPNTVYYFRLVAANGTGRIVGQTATFTTAAAPAPLITITGRGINLRRRFIAKVRLHCTSLTQACTGILKLFRKHRLIGAEPFDVAAGTSHIVAVPLDRRGRNLMAHYRKRGVEVVARGTSNKARRFMNLIRRF